MGLIYLVRNVVAQTQWHLETQLIIDPRNQKREN